MSRYAILVEYDVPDGVDFAVEVATPLMDTLRALDAPATPTLITAVVGDAAEAMTKAREAS